MSLKNFSFQVAYLFTFLAQQIAKEENCLNVSRELFKKVLDVLTDTTEKSHHEERQQALLDMLSAGALDYLEDEVKLKARNVGFYRSVKYKVMRFQQLQSRHTVWPRTILIKLRKPRQ